MPTVANKLKSSVRGITFACTPSSITWTRGLPQGPFAVSSVPVVPWIHQAGRYVSTTIALWAVGSRTASMPMYAPLRAAMTDIQLLNTTREVSIYREVWPPTRTSHRVFVTNSNAHVPVSHSQPSVTSGQMRYRVTAMQTFHFQGLPILMLRLPQCPTTSLLWTHAQQVAQLSLLETGSTSIGAQTFLICNISTST